MALRCPAFGVFVALALIALVAGCAAIKTDTAAQPADGVPAGCEMVGEIRLTDEQKDFLLHASKTIPSLGLDRVLRQIAAHNKTLASECPGR